MSKKPAWLSMYLVVALMFTGCGATTSHRLTDQILVSDAVDRSVSKLDFRQLSHESVYLDTQFLRNIKGVGFVNADYIISSLRQQILACGCRLEEKREDADIVLEARIGALGTDMHDVTYGLPASNVMTTASALIPSAPILPTLPEIAFAKRNDQVGAAKIAVFAYDRDTKERIWQSGTALASSFAKDTWVLGAGPFQRGTIYEGTKFAGADLKIPFSGGTEMVEDLNVTIADRKFFGKPEDLRPGDSQLVDYEEIVPLEEPKRLPPVPEPLKQSKAAPLKPLQSEPRPKKSEPQPAKPAPGRPETPQATTSPK